MTRLATNQMRTFPSLESLEQAVETAIEKDLAPATKHSYRCVWGVFEAFAQQYNLVTLPADPRTISLYLTYRVRSSIKITSLWSDLSAIAYYHRKNGFPNSAADPLVRAVMKSLERDHGLPADRKRALLGPEITSICCILDERGGIISLRDKSAILVGFAGALRISELISLRVADVLLSETGLEVLIRRSKTDQAGHGVRKHIVKGKRPSTDPVLAFRDWLETYEMMHGARLPLEAPLFPALYPRGDREKFNAVLGHYQNGNVIAMRNKRMRANLKELVLAADPNADPKKIGFHSVRSGHATTASANGARREDIAKQGDWKSVEGMQPYLRPSENMMDNSSGFLGL